MPYQILTDQKKQLPVKKKSLIVRMGKSRGSLGESSQEHGIMGRKKRRQRRLIIPRYPGSISSSRDWGQVGLAFVLM